LRDLTDVVEGIALGRGLYEITAASRGWDSSDALCKRLLCAPLNKRLLAQIARVQFEQIEAIHARRHMSTVQQRKEVRLTLAACGNQLAVDDAVLYNPLEGAGGVILRESNASSSRRAARYAMQSRLQPTE
jgi:hypothetical protein